MIWASERTGLWDGKALKNMGVGSGFFHVFIGLNVSDLVLDSVEVLERFDESGSEHVVHSSVRGET